MNKFWSDSEVAFLKENYLDKTQKEMALELGRTEMSVNRKATRLKLKKHERDIAGERFGRLTALEKTGADKYGSIVWKFKCDCGSVIERAATYAIRGKTNSCGCLGVENSSKARKLKLQGKRFGRLVVLDDTNKTNKEHQFLRRCICDCGKIIETTGSNLTTGGTQSCGCLKKERVIEVNRKREKRFGKDNPNYNHLLTKEEREGRAYIEPGKQIEWRKGVYRKDNYTCRICNKRGGHLNAHHLYSWSAFPDKRFNIDNGVTLCRKCHKKFHSAYGIKNNTREQFESFRKETVK